MEYGPFQNPFSSMGPSGGGGIAFEVCARVGEKIADANPNSDVLYFIGGAVHWIGGIAGGIYAGMGGLVGSFVPWAIKEAFGTVHRHSELGKPFQFASGLSALPYLVVMHEDRPLQLTKYIMDSAANVTQGKCRHFRCCPHDSCDVYLEGPITLSI
jgi:hypothetical protein